jgi:porin
LSLDANWCSRIPLEKSMNLRPRVSLSGPWLAAILGLSLSAPLWAQPYPVPATWGGDLGSRERLTGDWGGLRDEWAKAGFVLGQDATRLLALRVGIRL